MTDEALDGHAYMLQMANEILRLRAENEKLREETRSKGERIGGYVNMLVKREAEIEKLRAALDDAAVELEFAHFASMNKRYKKAAKTARKAAALKETVDER